MPKTTSPKAYEKLSGGRNNTLSTLGKHPFLLTVLAVSLFLSASATSCKLYPAAGARATYRTGEAETSAANAERMLSTFDEIITVVVLMGGSIFGAYCLRRSNKTRRDPARRRRFPASKEGK